MSECPHSGTHYFQDDHFGKSLACCVFKGIPTSFIRVGQTGWSCEFYFLTKCVCAQHFLTWGAAEQQLVTAVGLGQQKWKFYFCKTFAPCPHGNFGTSVRRFPEDGVAGKHLTELSVKTVLSGHCCRYNMVQGVFDLTTSCHSKMFWVSLPLFLSHRASRGTLAPKNHKVPTNYQLDPIFL